MYNIPSGVFRGSSGDSLEPPSGTKLFQFHGGIHEKKTTKNNQRTNGPVNAHLKPEIYTNKLV